MRRITRSDRTSVNLMSLQASFDAGKQHIEEVFHDISLRLDEKVDLREQIIVLNRTILLESKRCITKLHSFRSGPEGELLLQGVENQIKSIVFEHFTTLMKLLYKKNNVPFRHNYSAGYEEFVEALSFYIYLKDKETLSFEDFKQFMLKHANHEKFSEILNDTVTESENTGDLTNEPSSSILTDIFDVQAFVLGLCDLTGELMRYSQILLAESDPSALNDVCYFLRRLYFNVTSVGCRSKAYTHKLKAFRRTVLKLERVCFKIKIRNSSANAQETVTQ